MAEASIAWCTQVNTESRAVWSAVLISSADQQPHHCSTGVQMHTTQSMAEAELSLLGLCFWCCTVQPWSQKEWVPSEPRGIGTSCHGPVQLWQCWHPSSSCFSPLLSGSQPVCLQRKSLSPKQNVLPMSWFFSSPAWSLLQQQPKLPERKSRVSQASNKLAFIIPAKPPSARVVSKCRLCWPLGDCYKPKNIKTSKLMACYSPSSQAPQEPCSGITKLTQPTPGLFSTIRSCK